MDIQRALDAVKEIADPFERAKAAEQLANELGKAVPAARQIRREAIHELVDQRYSFREIGERLGVSRQQVNNLHKGYRQKKT